MTQECNQMLEEFEARFASYTAAMERALEATNALFAAFEAQASDQDDPSE